MRLVFYFFSFVTTNIKNEAKTGHNIKYFLYLPVAKLFGVIFVLLTVYS